MTTPKLSDNERLKDQSHYLEGTIERDLSEQLTGGFQGDKRPHWLGSGGRRALAFDFVY